MLGIAEMRVGGKQPRLDSAGVIANVGSDAFVALQVSTEALPRAVDDLRSEPMHPVWDASEGLTQLWRISVPSTFRHSRMNAASAVQPFAETIVPST